MKKITLVYITLILSLFMTGCDSLSENVLRNHKSTVEFVDKAILHGSSNVLKFDQMKESDEFSFISDYEGESKWGEKLATFNKSMINEKSEYLSTVDPLIKKDESKYDRIVSSQSSNTSRNILELKQQSDGIIDYIEKMALFLNNKDKYLKESEDNLSSITSNFKNLTNTFEKYTHKYPEKSTDLASKTDHAKNILENSGKSILIVRNEHGSLTMNLHKFSLNILELLKLKKEMIEYVDYSNAKMAELDTSVIKILKAERIDYFVNIGFSSWCESDGCGSGDDGSKKVQVSEDIYEMADSSNAPVLVKLYKSWGSMQKKIFVSSQLINALKIDLNNIPHGNGEMEYWIDSVESKTWHKYSTIKNEVLTSSTNWESVSNDFFYKFEGRLGMPIYSKPYGYYNEEATAESTNILAQTIAEPITVNGLPTGRNQYGEWRSNNGNSFFHYYGQYALISNLMGSNNSYYSRDNGYQYSGYNRNPNTHRSQYRSNVRNGISNHSRFSGYKKSVSSRYRPSVRSSGGSTRGKGPSGGGK